MSSPRTWGCFSCPALHPKESCVFPTHVGVFPVAARWYQCRLGLPHARGGVSDVIFRAAPTRQSSPRTWGCFLRKKPRTAAAKVFPTHVGVFPDQGALEQTIPSLPHARGGVSRLSASAVHLMGSSPRTWGCFYLSSPMWENKIVFPTHVGVFLASSNPSAMRCSLPHARGGVSRLAVFPSGLAWSSPRTWGCFCGRWWMRH